MIKLLPYIGIIVLLVVAVALGTAIYKQQTGSSTSSPADQTGTVNKSISAASANPKSESSSGGSRTRTAEELEVLKIPGPNATAAEKKAHTDLVDQIGNKSGYPAIDIAGCLPFPVVYRVKQGGSISVKNPDKVDHILNATGKVTIKAGATQSVSSKDIGETLGEYGYGCDGSKTSVGIIQIIP